MKSFIVVLFLSLSLFFALIFLVTGYNKLAVILFVFCIEIIRFAIIKPVVLKLERIGLRQYRRQ